MVKVAELRHDVLRLHNVETSSPCTHRETFLYYVSDAEMNTGAWPPASLEGETCDGLSSRRKAAVCSQMRWICPGSITETLLF